MDRRLARAQRNRSRAREALAFFCAACWLPLYSFARWLGHASEDALNPTPGYFALLIDKTYLADVPLREGRVRAFLLTSFRYFLSKERDRAQALKRGGGRVVPEDCGPTLSPQSRSPSGPALTLAAQSALTSGTRLAVYEISASIGEGGMGQVSDGHDAASSRRHQDPAGRVRRGRRASRVRR